MRDDFPESVKRILAERVGWCCSYPDCNKITVGPHADPNKRISIGQACHIEAASPNGPRYNYEMTEEQRKSIQNGIWMCRIHAWLIDSDKGSYSVEMLKEWKNNAEIKALESIGFIRNDQHTDLYIENIQRHREIFSHLRDIEFFSLYWCRKNHFYYLDGMGGLNIIIKDDYIELQFLRDECSLPFQKDFQYIGRVNLPVSRMIDLIVGSCGWDETMSDFYISYNFSKKYLGQEYFTINKGTNNAGYYGDFYIKEDIIYDDLGREIAPSKEVVYNEVIKLCRVFYHFIAP
ncbi:hypothetical protein [Enterobacter sp. 186315]